MLDIGIITILFFITGYLSSYGVNKIYTDFDPANTYNKGVLFLEILSQLFLIGINIYIIRNLIQIIPFPLDGIYGYKHNKVIELTTGGVALGFGVFFAQDSLKAKLSYIFK